MCPWILLSTLIRGCGYPYLSMAILPFIWECVDEDPSIYHPYICYIHISPLYLLHPYITLRPLLTLHPRTLDPTIGLVEPITEHTKSMGLRAPYLHIRVGNLRLDW